MKVDCTEHIFNEDGINYERELYITKVHEGDKLPPELRDFEKGDKVCFLYLGDIKVGLVTEVVSDVIWVESKYGIVALDNDKIYTKIRHYSFDGSKMEGLVDWREKQMNKK